MGLFDKLPTLGEVNARPRAVPKAQTPKADVAKAAAKTKSADGRALTAWANKVKQRDKWKDRYDGQRVIRIVGPNPRRAEAHHIVPRSDKAVRHDVRNGITLSLVTHELVEKNRLKIEGTKFFVVDGKRYIDATHPVRFVASKES